MATATAAVIPSVAGLTCCSLTRSSTRSEGGNTSFFGSALHSDRRCREPVSRRNRGLPVRAARTPPPQGWGKAGKLKSLEGQRRREKEKSLEGWTEVAQTLDVEEGKNKATIYKGKGYVVAKVGEELYGIDANCASCKFPLIEGNVTMAADDKGPQIECPLCHSKYLLADGTVAEYCPKDGPIQWVVGTIKEKAPRENTKVYPARMSRSGRVYFQFVKAPSPLP